jgi:hypothetical protein
VRKDSLFKQNNTSWFFSRQLLLASMAGWLFFMTACVAVVPDQKSVEEEVKENWGIEITSLRMSAAGHMIDFRYRVLDAKKAETLFDRANKPYLIDQKSEKVLAVPSMGKIGPLRTSNKPQEGRIYWMFFGNPGGLVKAGNKVTVVIGDFRAEDLVVQ